MKLQEKMFLCELIKRNYRRRMTWFWLQFFTLVACLCGVISHFITGSMHTIATISIIGSVALIVNASRLYMSVFSSGFPWKIKQDQADTLEQIWKEVDFEDLRGYVRLNEYTEV